MKIFMIMMLVCVSLPSCLTRPNPYAGGAYSNLKGPMEAVAGAEAPTKRGEACATSVLGLAAWGDASIAAARTAGKIERIATVDYKHFSVVEAYHIFQKSCTIVTGS